MDCTRGWSVVLCLMLAVVTVTLASNWAAGESKRGTVYDTSTQPLERAPRRNAGPSRDEPGRDASDIPRNAVAGTGRAKNAQPDFAVEQAAYQQTGFEETEYCGETSYCDDTCVGCGAVDCGDCVGGRAPIHGLGWFVGFEATYLRPYFENNLAYTRTESNGTTSESTTEVDFNYDLVFNPRVFMGWQNCDGLGVRATWWQFDHAAGPLSDSPPANGFGEIAPAPFDGIDISTNVPTDLVSADSDLKLYSIDFEGTRQASLGCWDIGVGGGIRYAFAEQHYRAQTRDSGNDLRGEIDFAHSIEGIGPTISLDAHRILTPTLATFCKARGSVLFGNGKSRLEAGEDLDLANSFTTTSTTSRDDLLSIGEIQVGVRWQALPNQYRIFIPFFSAAFEGQVWNGAGSAASEDGNLGFLGFNTGIGFGF